MMFFLFSSSTPSPSIEKLIHHTLNIKYPPAFAVILLEVMKALKYIEYPAFNKRDAISLVPLSSLFVGMIVSGFVAISYINVPLMTVFKNMTNLITMSAEWYLFSEPVNNLMVCSVVIMAIGACFAALNDVEFNLYGYIWVAINCTLTACYVLYMRYASSNINVPRFGMVFYNNLISLVFLAPLIFVFNEVPALFDGEVVNRFFFLSNTLAGLFGVSLNFASLWCVSSTSGTTYAVVGTLSKIPIIILGSLMFQTSITMETYYFIFCGIFGGFLYGYAKLKLPKGS